MTFKVTVVLFSLVLLVVLMLVQSNPANGKGKDKATNPGPKRKNRPVAKGKLITPEDGIPGSYIVTYKDGVSVKNKGKSAEAKGKRLHRTETLSMVLMTDLSDADVKDLEMDDDVVSVEQDQIVTINCKEYSTKLWGLDRLDQSGTTYDDTMFINDTRPSRNVNVYVLDTGIDADHPDFMGRARQVYSVIPGETTDGNGHGTHCAGTVAGANFGVAKRARVKGVKVLNNSGSGSYNGVIKGIDYVINKHNKRNTKTNGQARTVISMSLGGGYSAAMNAAIVKATDAGIPCVVAAGNSGDDVDGYSPASAPEALTVAASNEEDNFAYFSNHGDLVDIVAPGVGITSAVPSSCANPPPAGEVPPLDHPCMTTGTWSGTSMATPHMAGIIANYLKSLERTAPQPSPADIFAWVKNNADFDAINNPPAFTTPDVGQLNPCYGA